MATLPLMPPTGLPATDTATPSPAPPLAADAWPTPSPAALRAWGAAQDRAQPTAPAGDTAAGPVTDRTTARTTARGSAGPAARARSSSPVGASAPAALAAAPATSTVPRPPAPPGFGYAWIGRVVQQGRARALIANAERGLAVAEGDLLDGQWRVERVDPQGLELLWLPGGQRLRLDGVQP